MTTMLSLRRVAGAACRVCLATGEIALPAAPATVDVTPDDWAAIQEAGLAAQFERVDAPEIDAPPAEAPPAEKE